MGPRLKRHLPHVALHIALAVALIAVLVSAPLSLSALSHQAKAPKSPVAVVSAHVCDRHDYAMGCALPQASVGEIIRGVDPVLQGVDFGWSCPVGVARNFGASYLSYDTGKDWTLSCVRLFHSQGKGTVAVWEAGANDATRGFNLGFSQARRAAQELSALGAPAKQPFDMAVDCDCAGSTLVGYFQGANAAEPGRVNAYGGYFQVLYLYQHHLVGHLNWQTYAWSGGRWLPASVAPLEQYLNSSAVDYDRAIAGNFGQWPAPASIALPVKVSCFGHTHLPRTCKREWASAAKASEAAYTKRGCAVPAQRIAWFSKELRRHPRVKVARRNRALASSRAAYRHRSCAVFAQRAAFFAKRAR